MNTKTRRRTALVGGLMALSLIAAACGDDDDSDAGGATTTAGAATTAAGAATTAGGAATTAGGTATTAASGGGLDPACADVSATLNASGATFPQAFYEEAIEAFAEEAPDITINYGGGGSGKGRQDLADQVVDWAGTDGLIKEEDVASFKGGEVLYFPTVLAPITVSYNLDVDELELTPDQIAKIFQREITNWNDRIGRSRAFPTRSITVAVRSDGSGTTENFTKFLERRRRRRRDGLEAGNRLDGRVAGRHAGRRGQLGAWPRSSRTPRAPSATSTCPTAKASGLKYASVAEQGR